MSKIDLRLGDCLDVLKTLDDNSVDSIVTDPPYGLSFMGKAWDKSVPSVEVWQECLRVLKPGGHLLSFAGTRTQHRMAVAIEDAGFEIRDMIAWMYSTGFPKSHDVSKGIDKVMGAEREVVGEKITGGIKRPPKAKKSSDEYDENRGNNYTSGHTKVEVTKPASSEAKQWEGWGSALKPALEPITVARKPFDTTIAKNVLKWGTGGINIDACRVPTEDSSNHSRSDESSVSKGKYGDSKGQETHKTPGQQLGRFPANLIHDGSDEVVSLFPESKGQQGDVKGTEKSKTGGVGTNCYGEYKRIETPKRNDSGSAARFFYCAKASKKDRNEGIENPNTHPTLKPTKLMRYLCKLVTPPNGTVLDPFMGSGSTGKGAVLEGFDFIGIELDENYLTIAKNRIEYAMDNPEEMEDESSKSKKKEKEKSPVPEDTLDEFL